MNYEHRGRKIDRLNPYASPASNEPSHPPVSNRQLGRACIIATLGTLLVNIASVAVVILVIHRMVSLNDFLGVLIAGTICGVVGIFPVLPVTLLVLDRFRIVTSMVCISAWAVAVGIFWNWILHIHV